MTSNHRDSGRIEPIDVDTLTVCVFIVYIVLNLAVVLPDGFGMPKSLAQLPLFAIAVPAIRGLVRSGRVPVTSTTLFALLWLAALLATTASSPFLSQAMEAVNAYITEGLGLFLLVTLALSSPTAVRRAIITFAVTVGLLALLTVIQQATRSFSNDFFGLARVEYVSAGVGLPDRIPNEPRLAGPIGETNRYAQLLTMTAPLAFYAYRWATKPAARIGFVLVGAATLMATVATGSRGAMATLAVLLILLTITGYLKPIHLVTVAAAATAAVLVLSPHTIERIAALTTADDIGSGSSEVDGALAGRTQASLAAFQVFVDHPAMGVGPEQFFHEYSQEYGNRLNLKQFDTPRRAHNLYLEVAADMGVLGLTVLVGLLASTMVSLNRLRQRLRSVDPVNADLAAAMLFAVMSYAGTGMFLHLAFQRYFWTLMAMASATIFVLRQPAPAGETFTTDRATVPTDSSTALGTLH